MRQLCRCGIPTYLLFVPESQVALVARGKPLEIVTNSASKRKTEMAVNFDRGDRNFGSDAYALVSRKPKQTYTKMTTMLGERRSIEQDLD